MIFSNDGHTQIAGNPADNMREITWIIRTLRARYEKTEGPEFIDKMLVFAGRLSTLSVEEEDGFHKSLAGQNVDIDELLAALDEYLGQK